MKNVRLFSFSLLLASATPFTMAGTINATRAGTINAAMAGTIKAEVGFKMVDCGKMGEYKCAKASLTVSQEDLQALGRDPLIQFHYYKGFEMPVVPAKLVYRMSKSKEEYMMVKTDPPTSDNPAIISDPKDHHFFILNDVCLDSNCRSVEIIDRSSAGGYEYKTVDFSKHGSQDSLPVEIGFQMIKCGVFSEARCARATVHIDADIYNALGQPDKAKYQYSKGVQSLTMTSPYFQYEYSTGKYELSTTDRKNPSNVKDLHFFTLTKVCINYDCVDVRIKNGTSAGDWQYRTLEFPHQPQSSQAASNNKLFDRKTPAGQGLYVKDLFLLHVRSHEL